MTRALHSSAIFACAAVLLVGCGRESAASDEESSPVAITRAGSDDVPATLDVPADHPYVGPALAEFELVECHGASVGLDELAGRTVVLDFVFTTCAGPCPSMTANMRRLQDELADTEVLLVSVSVDPETDDAAVLRGYSETYGADPERWWFLTGAEDQMGALAESVYLAVVPDDTPDALIGYQVAHSTKFLVVDDEGRVRGYYDGRSEEGLAAVVARARHLDGAK